MSQRDREAGAQQCLFWCLRGERERQGREAGEGGRGESSSYNYPTANLLHVSGLIANKL